MISNEVPAMPKAKGKAAARRRRKPGKKPLVPGEATVRVTCNLPESMLERAARKAGSSSMSAYLRRLVENDLARAS